MAQRLVTVHYPERRDRNGKVLHASKCTHEKPECNMTHYAAVPAIETRGSWKFGDLLSNSSIENLITAYTLAGGTFRE